MEDIQVFLKRGYREIDLRLYNAADEPIPDDPSNPDDPSMIAVTSISLDKTTLTLDKGQTYTLMATIKTDKLDLNGDDAKNHAQQLTQEKIDEIAKKNLENLYPNMKKWYIFQKQKCQRATSGSLGSRFANMRTTSSLAQ